MPQQTSAAPHASSTAVRHEPGRLLGALALGLCLCLGQAPLRAADGNVLEAGQKLLPDLCAPPIYQAINGTMPSGAEKRRFTQASYEALLATLADPSVPDSALGATVHERMVEADPSLAQDAEPNRPTHPSLYRSLATPVLDVAVQGATLSFVCTIANFGSGWKPFEIMISRKGRRSGVTVPLIANDEKN